MGHLPDITFLSFGKPKQVWRPVLEIYEKRLTKATGFKHVILREKGEDPAAVKANAAKVLAPYTGPDVYTLVFDERGKSHTSKAFAKLLTSVRPKKLAAVIGSSYGLSDEFLDSANHLMNLGSLTLPHELARVTALEQLYRAETILANHPYHHS